MQTQKDRLLKIQESFYQESVKKYQKFFTIIYLALLNYLIMKHILLEMQ